jgi:Flp pilus assembly protein TadG
MTVGHLSHRVRAKDSAAVAVMAALLLPLMLGVCALVLDMGMIYANRRALQNAADAAALAGATELRRDMLGQTSDPAGQARTFAARNGVATSGATCTPDGKATVVVNVAGSDPTTHSWQVTTSKLVRLTFGSALGIHLSA